MNTNPTNNNHTHSLSANCSSSEHIVKPYHVPEASRLIGVHPEAPRKALRPGGVANLPAHVLSLLAEKPVRGGGLNDWLFYASSDLAKRGWTTEEITEFLERETTDTKPGEIERAVERGRLKSQGKLHTSGNRTPKWPSVNNEQRAAIIAEGCNLETLWAVSPVPCKADQPDVEEVIDILFPGNPLLCVGQSKEVCMTQERDKWRGKLPDRQLIVPSPMSARIGKNQDGKESKRCLDVTSRI